jgi:protein FAM50
LSFQETEKKGASAAERFTARTEGAAEKLAKSTVGLVTLDEFRRTRDEIEEAQRMEAAQKQSTADLLGAGRKKKDKKKKEKVKLSFARDGEDEEEGDGDAPSTSNKKRSNEDSDGE